jgi:hypothetical protein
MSERSFVGWRPRHGALLAAWVSLWAACSTPDHLHAMQRDAATSSPSDPADPVPAMSGTGGSAIDRTRGAGGPDDSASLGVAADASSTPDGDSISSRDAAVKADASVPASVGAARVPGGAPPPAIAAGAVAPAELSAHALTYAQSPADNPVKGFAPYFFSKTDYANGYSHSMEWGYFPLNALMTGPNTFDWEPLDQMLDEVASRGNSSVFRPFIEYPGRPSGLPSYLSGSVAIRQNTVWGTASPDYDDPRLVSAMKTFIAALGARYDGDPRVAYIHMGLIGLWGEWHTWPFDADTSDGYPNLMPTAATQAAIINAYDAAFDRTEVEVRYATLGNDAPATANVGLHDDSWCYREARGGVGPLSMTLPQSMGGWNDAFVQLAINAGAENLWVTSSIGGEVRPEIQGSLLTGGGQVDPVIDCIEVTHATWMINQQGITGYGKNDPAAAAAVARMGYELYVKSAHLGAANGGTMRVGVTIENRGVARFPYPWRVEVGLRNAAGAVVASSTADWDLRAIQPIQIRAFSDWKVPGAPKYLPFGQPLYLETSLSTTGLPAGAYQVVVHVVNPLSAVTEQEVRARKHIETWMPFSAPKSLRFANAEQGTDGWLVLGTETR